MHHRALHIVQFVVQQVLELEATCPYTPRLSASSWYIAGLRLHGGGRLVWILKVLLRVILNTWMNEGRFTAGMAAGG